METVSIMSHDYSAPPVWEPLEALAPAGFDLSAAMYMGAAELGCECCCDFGGERHGTGELVRVYKNADTRRVIYVGDGLVGKWQNNHTGDDGVVVPFWSLNAALTWWMS